MFHGQWKVISKAYTHQQSCGALHHENGQSGPGPTSPCSSHQHHSREHGSDPSSLHISASGPTTRGSLRPRSTIPLTANPTPGSPMRPDISKAQGLVLRTSWYMRGALGQFKTVRTNAGEMCRKVQINRNQALGSQNGRSTLPLYTFLPPTSNSVESGICPTEPLTLLSRQP